jgi:antitoxin component HigA of HigAB toxin-antitoxin module
MTEKTKFQEFIEDAERHRIFEQESLAFEATELIFTLLKEQQLTKADLAKRIGKSKAYVTQLLSGSRNMTLHTFADLVFALGYKVDLRPSHLSRSKREGVVYKFRSKAVRGWGGGMVAVSISPPKGIEGEFCPDFAPAA